MGISGYFVTGNIGKLTLEHPATLYGPGLDFPSVMKQPPIEEPSAWGLPTTQNQEAKVLFEEPMSFPAGKQFLAHAKQIKTFQTHTRT